MIKQYLILELDYNHDSEYYSHISNVTVDQATDSSSIHHLSDEDAELITLSIAREYPRQHALIKLLDKASPLVEQLKAKGQAIKEKEFERIEADKRREATRRKNKEAKELKAKEEAAQKEKELFEQLKVKYLGQKED